ncbi:hypothetical protein [Methylobacterium sp. WL120]|uniref:hypothetical protein n=1 Tax=Methylobacterium sp. WL120 TaxID=2603887 RepID=UPI0011C95834|nr:hypothetical protein [Methylobacterium sp. WL120]TXM65789.1 hypothetical protein FV229_14515 [Methylobacterium sp. WL120]
MQQQFSWYVLFSGLFGAVFGGIIAATIGFWKFHRDEFSARCDELCKTLVEAGGVSAEYWSQTFEDNQQYRARILEAKLLGMQSLIDGLSAQVSEKFWAKDNVIFSNLLSEMSDGLTGGQFSEAGRQEDLVRIRKASQVAGELTAAIRVGHRHTMPFQGFMKV